MKVLDFDYSDKLALTVDEQGLIEVWSEPKPGYKKLKVFQNENGQKAVLCSDKGYQFKKDAETAPYCKFADLWFGEFPYSSWAWGIHQCSVTGKVKVTTLTTEINPRGLTETDLWRKECRTYVPKSVAVAV